MKIKLKIQNKDVELSADEAKDLFNQLNQIFGGEIKIIKEIIREKEYIPPYYPEVIPTTIPPWTFTCKKNNLDFFIGDPPGSCAIGGLKSF